MTKEAQRIIAKYPGYVPVICRRLGDAAVKGKKILVPRSMRGKEFAAFVRDRWSWCCAETRVQVGGEAVPESCSVSELYEKHKAVDKFLHVVVGGDAAEAKATENQPHSSCAPMDWPDLHSEVWAHFEATHVGAAEAAKDMIKGQESNVLSALAEARAEVLWKQARALEEGRLSGGVLQPKHEIAELQAECAAAMGAAAALSLERHSKAFEEAFALEREDETNDLDDYPEPLPHLPQQSFPRRDTILEVADEECWAWDAAWDQACDSEWRDSLHEDWDANWYGSGSCTRCPPAELYEFDKASNGSANRVFKALQRSEERAHRSELQVRRWKERARMLAERRLLSKRLWP